MPLSALKDDPARLDALVEILCSAAGADEYIASQELASVEATLRDKIGLGEIPDAVREKLATYDPSTFDIASALERLAPSDDVERQAVLDAAIAVVVADRFVDSSEYGFIGDLAAHLGLPTPTKFS